MPKQRCPENPEEVFTPASLHLKVYKLLRDTDAVLEDGGIEYWAIGGTLLGLERHGAMIPYDDDVDIAVPDEFEACMLNLPWSRVGLAVEEGDTGYHVYREGSRDHYPFVDIFIVTPVMRKKKERWVFRDQHVRALWPEHYMLNDNVFPLRRARFGPAEMWAPKRHLPLLNRGYRGWKTEAITPDYDHRKSEEIPPGNRCTYREKDVAAAERRWRARHKSLTRRLRRRRRG